MTNPPTPSDSGGAGSGRVDAHRETVQATPAPSGADATAGADRTGFASWVGRTIDDRYRIESLLGEGGMGAVLLAEHLKLSKKVALKVILPQFAGVGELAERFAREAMASAKLDHPHVASALDYGVLAGEGFGDGGAYLVMQLVRGESLRDAMSAHVGDWAFACEVGAQIADALSAAHAARIVHRDLKPENVMLESRESGGGAVHVRVLDFGVARVVGDEAVEGPGTRKLTRVGTILGTPGYMAPEQALGESVDERADLYALGVILWECIVGRELFPGADVPTILTAQLTTPVDPVSLYAPGVPPELGTLVGRLLAPKREDRPSRAAEVRDTLRKLALTRQLERVSAASAGANHGLRESTGGVLAPTLAASPSGEPLRERASEARLPLASLFPGGARGSLGIYLAAAGALALGLLVIGLVVGSVIGGSGTAPTSSSPTSSSPTSSSTMVPVPLPPGTRPMPPPTGIVPTTPSTPTIPTAPPMPSLPAGQAPPSAPAMTPEIARDLAIVLESNSRETRRTAAEALLARGEASLPPLAAALAELETADGCNAKRAALRTLRELRDPLALPAVERIDRLPRRGCGPFGLGDCWSCLRGETRRTMRSLRGEAAAGDTGEGE